MDDERCDCLFSRSKPQFWGLLMLIQVCIPTRESGNEEGLPRHSRKDLPRHSRKTLPAIPAKHSPSFPQNTPRHSRKTLPVIPAKAGIHKGATDP